MAPRIGHGAGDGGTSMIAERHPAVARTVLAAALPASVAVADFDGVQSGTVIPSGAAVDGIAITYALGVSIITKEALQDGDLALSAGGATAVLSAGGLQQPQ